MKSNLINKKGITLIALVVTIIVLLILAGVSISMLTGQNGILNRAAEAKEKTGRENEKEAVNMAALEALTEGKVTITKEILKKTLKSYLGKNDIELIGNGPWQYQGTEGAYTITEGGSVAKGWICLYDANGAPEKVTNGKVTLNIGDYINYNPGTNATYTAENGIYQNSSKASDYQILLDDTSNANIKDIGTGISSTPKTFTAISTPSDVKWRVLGADEETGELQIFATKNVSDLTLRGITGYCNGIKELNYICNVYGQGKGATGGQSITYEGIAKAIGRPVTTLNESWTISWGIESPDKKSPTYTVGGSSGYFNNQHYNSSTNIGAFNYLDVNTGKWMTNEQDLNNQITEDIPITTLIKDYNGYSLVTVEQSATKGHDVVFKANEAYIGDGSRYWLGSSYRYVNNRHSYWGLYGVNDTGYVGGYHLYDSIGNVGTLTYGVRPVVSLQTDIQLEKDATLTDTYNIK